MSDVVERVLDEFPDEDWSATLDDLTWRERLPDDCPFASNSHTLVRRDAVDDVPDDDRDPVGGEHAVEAARRLVDRMDGYVAHDVDLTVCFETGVFSRVIRVEWPGDPVWGKRYGYVDGDKLVAVARATDADEIRVGAAYRKASEGSSLKPERRAPNFALFRDGGFVGSVMGLNTGTLDYDYQRSRADD